MSNDSTVTGMIGMDPPVIWKDFRDSRFRPDEDGYVAKAFVKLHVTSAKLDCEEGIVTLLNATGIAPLGRSAYPVDGMVDDVQEIVDAYPDRAFTGYLECCTDDGDWSRVAVVKGRARRYEPQMTWPAEVR